MVSFDICEGNLGALAFLSEAYFQLNPFEAEVAFQRMQDNGITGAQLYMLWSDCCDRDTKETIRIMKSYEIRSIVEHINYENGRGIPFESMRKEAQKHALD